MPQLLQFRRAALSMLLLFVVAQPGFAQAGKKALTLNKSELTIERVNVPHITRFDSAIPLNDNEPHLACGLRLEETTNPSFYFRAPKARQAGKTANSTITVDFVGPEWTTGNGPAAQAAVLRAAASWEGTLESAVEIRVEASFANLGANVLGSAGASAFWAISGFTGSMPVNSNNTLIIGSPLADAILGFDAEPDSSDIRMQFSSGFASWNFSESPPGPGEWDFESVVHHELGHGLDFLGFASYDDGAAPNECDGTLGHGCQQVAITGGSTVEIFNYNVVDSNGDDLWDYTIYAENSATLGTAFLGDYPTSGAGLFWGGASGSSQNGGPAKLYMPNPYVGGSTFSHLDDATFDGTLDNLMTHAIANGEMAREPGPVTCGMMEDQLWSLVVPAGDCPNAALPVEMVDFAATVDNFDVIVDWKTVTEGSNAGFEIEHRVDQTDFETVGYVPGAGESRKQLAYSYRVEDLKPGSHFFRLKQLDLDGSAAYGPEIEAFVGVPDDYYLRPAYPNPFSTSATIAFAAGQSQNMKVELYNMQGRMVRVLYAGVVDANSQYEARIDAAGLASGVYIVRMSGDRTLATQRVTIMK